MAIVRSIEQSSSSATRWRLLGAKQEKFIGPSTEAKPRPPDYPIPNGSTCLEEDTGRIFRWRDNDWRAAPQDPTADLLIALLDQIVALRQDFEFFVNTLK